MRTLIWSNTFLRAFKRLVRKQPDIRKEVEETLKLLIQDPFIPQLETHKLKGKLSGSWSCSIGYNFRIIFDFVGNKQKENDIFLLTIGAHDEVH